MSEISFYRQAVDQSRRARKRIAGLNPSDPNKDWFAIELQSLEVSEGDDKLGLEEANARLVALKQLLHLLMQHCVRLQNPGYDDVVGEIPQSFLTVQARLPSNVLDSTRLLGFSIEPSLLHDPAAENPDFDPVSPTAKIVAYLRGLDRSLQIDGGFSPETEGASLLSRLGITETDTQIAMATLFQSRYHAINAAMSHTDRDVLQIVEFGAGISPRGYQWSLMNPGTIYLESDLAQLMIHKAKLIRNARLKGSLESRGLHHCCGVDVLDRDSLFKAVSMLDSEQPFTLVTEGLLLYFGEPEMRLFLANMQELLTQYPLATWVTDFVSRQNLRDLLACHSGVAAGVKSVFSMTGRSVIPINPFESEECVHRWLAKFGLHTHSTVSLADAAELIKFDMPIDPELRHAIVGSRKIWRISARQSSLL